MKKVFGIITMSAILLVMAIPAFANTSNWAWTGTAGGNIVNGKTNGVFHTMTAGNLTFSGSVWATYVPPAPTSPSQWYYQVRKNNGIAPDSTVCSYGPVTTNGLLGHSASFYTSCGYINAGNDYYLYVSRGNNDGRAYSSSGNLSTP